MCRQSNPITPHETCLELVWSKFKLNCVFFGLYFDFVLSPVFKYKALVGVLSSSIEYFTKVGFSWQPLSEKQKFFIFYVFFHANTNLATSPKRLETELTNIPRWHFCSLPVFCIEHSFIYFSFLLSELFSVICLFWHTFTARDDTRTRQHTRQGSK